MAMPRVILVAMVVAVGAADPLNVLVLSTVPSPSHHIFLTALTDGLLERGHRVTELVFHLPAVKNPNRTSFLLEDCTRGEDLEHLSDMSLWEEFQWLYNFCEHFSKEELQFDAAQKLMKHLKQDKPHFDVMIIDYVLQEPFIAFSTLAGRPPVVAISAYNMPVEFLNLMGSPYLASLLPYGGTGAHGGEPMTLKERVYNVYKWVLYQTYTDWFYRPKVDRLISQVFPGAPPLAELEKDVAVALVNTNPALHGAMPLVPGIIEVGGMQAKPPKPLPADLKGWLDSASDGFIFMSFGTNVKSADMPKKRRDAILKVFGRIKQRVLWKYEEDDIADKLPPNVRVSKWLPQNDILAHPNIRCFVSHNGGLSSQEASYHGVPILGVPFFFDQILYAEKTIKLGLGRTLRFKSITEESFYEALTDVIHNPRYRDNMKRLQRALRDQKETPLERAVWWVEYVARNQGAPHLRSPAKQLRWYQVFMLDVAALALAAVLLALWLLAAVVRTLAACLTDNKNRRKMKAH